MDQEKKKISTVHENDLKNLLEKLGLLEKVEKSIVKCKFCDTTITFDNLHSILPESGGFSLICSNPNCINKLVQYLDEKKLKQEHI
jgi:aspartate carbamoyltransferase regulatory subunit